MDVTSAPRLRLHLQRTGANIDALKNMLYQRAKEIHLTHFPYNDYLFQKYDDEDQYPEPDPATHRHPAETPTPQMSAKHPPRTPP